MRTIDTIIIHCSATPPEMDIGVTEIRKWHTDPKPLGRGWNDIGYHYVIRRNGQVEFGRAPSIAGAHAQGHNATSLGICLVGGTKAATNTPDCNFTPQQWATLATLVNNFRLNLYPSITKIIGHRDVSSKACPCFDVKSWAKGLESDANT